MFSKVRLAVEIFLVGLYDESPFYAESSIPLRF